MTGSHRGLQPDEDTTPFTLTKGPPGHGLEETGLWEKARGRGGEATDATAQAGMIGVRETREKRESQGVPGGQPRRAP